MTIREIISEKQNELAKGNLSPVRAAAMLPETASLIGNLNDELRTREIAYKKVLLECYADEETANRAKIKAETSKEYEDFRIAKDTKELAIEIMRSLKYFLKESEHEYEAARHQ